MLNYLRNLDRRIVFLLMGLAVALPILFKLSFPEPVPEGSQPYHVFDQIDNLPDGSRVLISFDFDPGSQGELLPMAMGFTRHCAQKHHKMYFMCLWPLGEPFVEDAMNIVIGREYPDLVYGEDFMSFGYKPGAEAVIKNCIVDMKTLFITDSRKTDLNKIPMTANIKSAKAMDLIINISAGDPGTKQWVQYAATPAGIPLVAGCTGVQAPLLYPYIPDPLKGLLPAIKGAAGYEQVLIAAYPNMGDPDIVDSKFSSKAALQRMGPQFVAHLLMVGFILLGNFIYFYDKKGGA
jgi:hypothetical protein